ncbi:MAG: hypothetical protein K9I68_09920 [Bacteroidales bacterium]|nr:hypothetical protein [Bacteroidales bacterium]
MSIHPEMRRVGATDFLATSLNSDRHRKELVSWLCNTSIKRGVKDGLTSRILPAMQ